MTQPDGDKWEQRYRDAAVELARPAPILVAFQHLLPLRGDALDLACGLGGSARLLARRGLVTRAWDSAAAAITKLARYAATEGLPLQAELHDVVAAPPPPAAFDVIVVCRFLERALCPAIAAALRPSGLLFYQTFVRDAVGTDGPANPAYRLERNELLRLFPQLTVRLYREEGRVGDTAQGVRNEAWLIAQRID